MLIIVDVGIDFSDQDEKDNDVMEDKPCGSEGNQLENTCFFAIFLLKTIFRY